MRNIAIRHEKTAVAPEMIIERLRNVKLPTMGWIAEEQAVSIMTFVTKLSTYQDGFRLLSGR
jgi:hypothetical protein